MHDATTKHPIAGAAGIGENVFLTGATGLLGTQIMKRILESHPRTRLALLVRSTPRDSAQDRVDKLLSRTLGEAAASKARDRVDVISGDIGRPGLGLDGERTRWLQARIDQVIHCAATIRFDLPLEIARRDNTEGTRNVLDLADGLPHLGRLDYVGTAYVAGQRTGIIKEDELDVGQGFWNSYERTKMEAETLVRAFGTRRPTAIYRPSIIVGDSRTGEATAFQGLYQILPLYMRQLVLAIPADPDTHPDLVPIDYVLDTLFALMNTAKSIGRCFHVVAGAGNTASFDELLRITADFTKVKAPPYVSFDTYHRFVKPFFRMVLWGKKRAAMLKGEYFLPYLSSQFVFDKTNTDACLEGLGITVPRPASYFRKLIAFQARVLGFVVAEEDAAVEAAAARGSVVP
jgi:thioester reductase-like protein